MYYELVYSLNVVKSFTKICFAPTCVREEPSKVHSSISDGLTTKYIDVAFVNEIMRGF